MPKLLLGLSLLALLVGCSKSEIAPDKRLSIVLVNQSALLSRDSLLEIAQTLKRCRITGLHLDVSFLEAPALEDDTFAVALQKGMPVTSDYLLLQKANTQAPPDYASLLGTKLPGLASSDAAGLWALEGIGLPWKEFLDQSPALFAPFAFPDSRGVISYIPLYAYHRGYLLEQASLSLANVILAPKGIRLKLSEDQLSVGYTSNGQWKSVVSRSGLSKPLGLDLRLAPFVSHDAGDLLKDGKCPDEGSLVIVGAGPGLGDDQKTPQGTMPGALLLVNMVNTLLYAVEHP